MSTDIIFYLYILCVFYGLGRRAGLGPEDVVDGKGWGSGCGARRWSLGGRCGAIRNGFHGSTAGIARVNFLTTRILIFFPSSNLFFSSTNFFIYLQSSLNELEEFISNHIVFFFFFL